MVGVCFLDKRSKRLPPIATLQFIKVREYELSEVFNVVEDNQRYEKVQTQSQLDIEHNHIEMNNQLSASIELERQLETRTAFHRTITDNDQKRTKLLDRINKIYDTTSKAPINDKNAIFNLIAFNKTGIQELKPKRLVVGRLHDCRVGHWSSWSTCSKTCGIGEMHRYRKILKHGKRGGRACPPLHESKWCGAEKGCIPIFKYFNWSY